MAICERGAGQVCTGLLAAALNTLGDALSLMNWSIVPMESTFYLRFISINQARPGSVVEIVNNDSYARAATRDPPPLD